MFLMVRRLSRKRIRRGRRRWEGVRGVGLGSKGRRSRVRRAVRREGGEGGRAVPLAEHDEVCVTVV